MLCTSSLGRHIYLKGNRRQSFIQTHLRDPFNIGNMIEETYDLRKNSVRRRHALLLLDLFCPTPRNSSSSRGAITRLGASGPSYGGYGVFDEHLAACSSRCFLRVAQRDKDSQVLPRSVSRWESGFCDGSWLQVVSVAA